jgi:hypothetical protein
VSIFKNIIFVWQDKEYTVKANEVMQLIAKIEDIISLQELTNSPKLSRISEAYTVALSHAGCEATIEEVYCSLFQSEGANVQTSITSLVMLMLPPDTYNPENNGGKVTGQA